MATPDRDRVVALSLQLERAHQELRDRLREARTRPGSLTEHCLAFCTALTAHHQGEDAGLFTELLRERPDLAGVVNNLIEDHEMIASILARVAELAGTSELAGTAVVASDGAATRDSIEFELDGLTAIMENHFRYEERAIGAALDAGVSDTGWPDQVFRFQPGPRGKIPSS